LSLSSIHANIGQRCPLHHNNMVISLLFIYSYLWTSLSTCKPMFMIEPNGLEPNGFEPNVIEPDGFEPNGLESNGLEPK